MCGKYMRTGTTYAQHAVANKDVWVSKRTNPSGMTVQGVEVGIAGIQEHKRGIERAAAADQHWQQTTGAGNLQEL